MSEEPTKERKSDFRLNASSVANNSEDILDEAGDKIKAGINAMTKKIKILIKICRQNTQRKNSKKILKIIKIKICYFYFLRIKSDHVIFCD